MQRFVGNMSFHIINGRESVSQKNWSAAHATTLTPEVPKSN